MSPFAKQWLEITLERVFQLDDARHNDAINALNAENSKIKGGPLPAFRHQGIVFTPWGHDEWLKQWMRARQPVPMLATPLWPQAEQMIIEHRRIELDRTLLRQLLGRFYEVCLTQQDIRDATPDCLAKMVPDLASMTRSPIRPDPLWTVDNDPTTRRLYDKMLPKMEAYSVLALMY